MEELAIEVAEDEGLDPENVSQDRYGPDHGESWDIDGQQWWLFADYEDAEEAAKEYFIQGYDENPEGYADFAQSYIEMSPTDIRIIAGEEADSYAHDLDDDEALDRMDDAALQDQLDQIEEEWEDLQETEDEDAYDAAEAQYEENKAAIAERARESIHDDIYQDTKEELEKDPWGWYTDRYGSGEGIPNWMSVNVEKMAEDVISNRGARKL
jgi:hypothetical protein